MKILFIGDIVGSIGRDALESYLPRLKRKYAPDVVIANGENAAAGRGITKSIYQDLMFMGVDMVTMGNHTWDQKEIFDFIDEVDYLIRPANFSPEAPGRGMATVKKMVRRFLSSTCMDVSFCRRMTIRSKKRTS